MLLLTSALNAQNSRLISGTVAADDRTPLEGVTVSEKGTSQKVTTSDDGKFSITVSGANPILVFSYVGYLEKEIAVNGQTSLSVQLSRDIESFFRTFLAMEIMEDMEASVLPKSLHVLHDLHG